MTRSHPFAHPAGLLAVVALFAWMTPAAARAQVRDGAHLFSPAAVTSANAAIADLQRRHNKGLVVESIASVSAAHMDAAKRDPAAYFKESTADRMRTLGVNGVYVLVCMDPRYVDVRPGKETFSRGDFGAADVKRLGDTLKTDLRGGNNDQALQDAVDDVGRAYTANIQGGPPPSNARGSSPAVEGGAAVPSRSTTPTPSVPGNPSGGFRMFGLGGLICAVIGLFIIFSLVKRLFGNRSGGGGNFGGGGMAGGPNYPTGGPNYGSGPMNPGGGNRGGGFGSGLLGGLLGGAAGGYVENKFEHRNDPAGGQSAGFPTGGGGADPTSGGGGFGGGGFDSGPSDAGQAADFSGGGDFGGGGDSGGGGDAGGGGDSGGGSF